MKKRKVASTSHSSSPKQPETLPDDAVLFNPLHDHESLWWIACWALLHYIPTNHNPESDECIEYASWIFHPTVFEAGRIEVLSLGLPKKIIALVPRSSIRSLICCPGLAHLMFSLQDCGGRSSQS